MRNNARWSSPFILGALLWAAPASAQTMHFGSGDSTTLAVVERQVDHYLQCHPPYMEAGLLVSGVHNGVVSTAGFGNRFYQDPTYGTMPVDADSAFAMGSVTKTFTSAQAALADQSSPGWLNSSLYSHLPAGLTCTGGTQPFDNGITLLELADFYSGLTDNEPTSYVTSQSDHTDLLCAVYDHCAAFGETCTTPGTSYRYSNWGFAILGNVLGAATTDWFNGVKSQVLLPLRMTSTTIRALPINPSEMATSMDCSGSACVTVTEGPPSPVDGNDLPAGGLYTTAADMGTWIAYSMGEGVAVPPTLATASSNYLQKPWLWDKSMNNWQGLAWQFGSNAGILDTHGAPMVQMNKNGAVANFRSFVGILPPEVVEYGTNTVIYTRPDGKADGIAIIANYTDGSTPDDVAALVNAILQDLVLGMQPLTGCT